MFVSRRVNTWDANFRTYLKTLETDHKLPVILCGDLNVAFRTEDMHNFYGRPGFPLDIPVEENSYKGDAKGLLKQAGCTPKERLSFQKLLDCGFIDAFKHLYPTEKSLGCFSYWSQRAMNRPFNKGNSLSPSLRTDSIENAASLYAQVFDWITSLSPLLSS